jgi:hypothetical protein
LTDRTRTGSLLGVTGGKSAVLLAAAMLLVPASAQAKRGSIYDLTKAAGFERVTFSGDVDANCAQFNTCGYTGAVTYTIGGKPKGKIVLTKARSGKVKASARYKTQGLTEASVTPPAPAEKCLNSVTHKTDVFSMSSSGSKFQSLILAYHAGASTDYLATGCPGLTEKDVAAAGALPEGLFRTKDVFRGSKPGFTMSGATPFKQAGFTATIEWDLRFKSKQRDCSPNCKLPAGTP